MPALWKKGILSAFKKNGELTMIIYYCITIIANIVAAIVFHKSINITLPKDWQKVLNDLHYAKDGKANFTVWSNKEYDELQHILNECISIVSDLNRKTAEIAANITADLAPSHIRKTAEYVGAFVYRFYSIDKLVSKLFEMDWIKTVEDNEKPAVCVVKN